MSEDSLSADGADRMFEEIDATLTAERILDAQDALERVANDAAQLVARFGDPESELQGRVRQRDDDEAQVLLASLRVGPAECEAAIKELDAAYETFRAELVAALGARRRR